MATRSTVTFKQGEKQIGLYVHYDGHPEYRIPQLLDFFKKNSFRSCDMSYTVANYIAYIKWETLSYQIKEMTSIKELQDHIKEWGSNSALYTGVGVFDRPYTEKELKDSWLEYAYDVELPTDEAGQVTITAFEVTNSTGKKTFLNVTTHDLVEREKVPC